jgi:hypothetical protein
MQTVGLPHGPANGLEAFQELERFLSDAAEAHLGLSELERGSERRSRELVRLSLQAHVDSRGEGDVGEAIVVSGPDGPVRLAYKRLHTRSVLTLFGEVRVTRIGYGAPHIRRFIRSTPNCACRSDAGVARWLRSPANALRGCDCESRARLM